MPTVKLSDCETFFQTEGCDESIFSNVLSWERPGDDCAEDILGYRVYRSSDKEGTYTALNRLDKLVMDTTYEDKGANGLGLTSLAFCYRISAVDRSGNESDLSDPVCNDNCPYYELPNVFTPNNDDCNDEFSAYGNPRNGGGEESDCIPIDTQTRCARFVDRVVFTVYNRWGKEVYSYTGASHDDVNDIYIGWDGRAADGTDLATGIYYYLAEVTFDSVDPAKREQKIKGWVHLVR